MYRKNNNSGTAIDFRTKTNSFWGSNGYLVLGETFHRKGNGLRVNPNLENWLYSDIYLNEETLAPNPSYAKIQGTIAHEIGHAFGLAHYNTNPYGSIMCQTSAGRQVQRVQREDNEAINAKY